MESLEIPVVSPVGNVFSYVTFDERGLLTGSYFQALPEEHVETFIKVSEEQRLNWNSYKANEARSGVELAPAQLISLDDFYAAEEKRLLEAIARIEKDTLENRGSRELSMRLLEREAAQRAAVEGETRTAGEILASVPYYVRLQQVNNEIAALRGEMALLWS